MKKSFLDSLEKVMSLLAFQDISKSPLSELIENSQRIKISSEVNYELLKSQSKEKGKNNNFSIWKTLI